MSIQAKCLTIILLLFSMPTLAQNYPLKHLKKHKAEFPSSIAELANQAQKGDSHAKSRFLHRSMLMMDYISSWGYSRASYVSQYQHYALPLLKEMSRSNSKDGQTALARSLIFRFEQAEKDKKMVDNYDVAIALHKAKNRALSSQIQTYFYHRTNNPENTLNPLTKPNAIANTSYSSSENLCDVFDMPIIRDYCKKSSEMTFIVTRVNGGSSTHYETIDAFFRTLNFTEFNNDDHVLNAAKNFGISEVLLNDFNRSFDLSNPKSPNYQDYIKYKPQIDANPLLFLQQNIKNPQKLNDPLFRHTLPILTVPELKLDRLRQ